MLLYRPLPKDDKNYGGEHFRRFYHKTYGGQDYQRRGRHRNVKARYLDFLPKEGDDAAATNNKRRADVRGRPSATPSPR